MLTELRKIMYQDDCGSVLEAAADSVVEDDNVRDAMLDDLDVAVMGAENDPEVKKLVDSIPIDDDDPDTMTEDDAKELIESVLVESEDDFELDNAEESDLEDVDEIVVDPISEDFDFISECSECGVEGCVHDTNVVTEDDLLDADDVDDKITDGDHNEDISIEADVDFDVDDVTITESDDDDSDDDDEDGDEVEEGAITLTDFDLI